MAICVFGYFMKTAAHFVVLAILVGAVQGGTQALSRSLFASLIPQDKSGEFFGFFGVAEKFAGILGPAVFRRRVEPKCDPGHHRILRGGRGALVSSSTSPKASEWRGPTRLWGIPDVSMMPQAQLHASSASGQR